MIMSPLLRKAMLTVHLVCSVGWIGAVVGYLALGVAAATSQDTQTVRAAWIAMELTGGFAIVPLALAALGTGLLMSVGTRWGVVRHYWVVFTLVLTVVCTVVLLVHMPTVTATASMLRRMEMGSIGGDLFHAGGGLLILLVIMVLNVYKPPGVTRYGWRKQQAEHTRRAGQPRP